ncbi:MAG TPA: response regulator transcription factor [Chloroflexota bacterium]|nr:response regulator transcription factor [Chloroflexota bacterium]
MTRILIVDDDPAIRRALQRNLTARGYEVSSMESGEDALREAAERTPELVVLDLMLPGMSGIEVCRELRAESPVPILVLSARGEERAKVRALDLGADDYLTKPFGMDELLARVRALLRRQPSLPTSEDAQISVGALSLNPGDRTVTRGGLPLELTPREFDLLHFLMRHQGKVLTHRLLLSELWGPDYFSETQYLRVFVNRLRRKIEDDPAHPRYLVTDPGVGYRLLSPG